MKLKKYDVYLSDEHTHKGVLLVTIEADGYLSALADANKLCKANHRGLYVGAVIEVK
jgi:hypothetical protein